VLFTPRLDADAASVRAFAQSLNGLFRSDASIERVTVGRRIDFDAGYQRSFGDATYKFAAVLEFADEEKLGSYLTSAAHTEVGRLFWELCESTVVSEHRMTDGRSTDLITLLGAD
jgi:hypothetical protein